MKRELEINDYKTVWTMAHKVRKAMSDRDAKYKLSGLVEVDESFFGPKSAGKRGRGAENKELVIIVVSTYKDKDGKEKPGFAHAFIAANAEADTIKNILERLGIPDKEIEPLIVAIRTDGWRSYQIVAKELEMIHYRAALRNPKDSMKLLPFSHTKLSQMQKQYLLDLTGVYHENIFNGIFQKFTTDLTEGFGNAKLLCRMYVNNHHYA